MAKEVETGGGWGLVGCAVGEAGEESFEKVR